MKMLRNLVGSVVLLAVMIAAKPAQAGQCYGLYLAAPSYSLGSVSVSGSAKVDPNYISNRLQPLFSNGEPVNVSVSGYISQDANNLNLGNCWQGGRYNRSVYRQRSSVTRQPQYLPNYGNTGGYNSRNRGGNNYNGNRNRGSSQPPTIVIIPQRQSGSNRLRSSFRPTQISITPQRSGGYNREGFGGGRSSHRLPSRGGYSNRFAVSTKTVFVTVKIALDNGLTASGTASTTTGFNIETGSGGYNSMSLADVQSLSEKAFDNAVENLRNQMSQVQMQKVCDIEPSSTVRHGTKIIFFRGDSQIASYRVTRVCEGRIEVKAIDVVETPDPEGNDGFKIRN